MVLGLNHSARWRGGRRYRLVPSRANGQPAYGCYLQDSHAPIVRAHGLLVLNLEGDQIFAVTRLVDSAVLPPFWLPRTLAE